MWVISILNIIGFNSLRQGCLNLINNTDYFLGIGNFRVDLAKKFGYIYPVTSKGKRFNETLLNGVVYSSGGPSRTKFHISAGIGKVDLQDDHKTDKFSSICTN